MPAFHDRGVARAKQGKHIQAVADFTQSLRLNPTNAATFAQRAESLRALKKHDLALRDMTNAMLLDPKHAAAYCGQRGLLHAARGEYMQALADYTVVLMLDPQHPNVPIWREEALRARREQRRMAPPPPPPQPQDPATEVLPAPELALIPTGTDVEMPIAAVGAAPRNNILVVGDSTNTDFELKMTPAQMAEIPRHYVAKLGDVKPRGTAPPVVADRTESIPARPAAPQAPAAPPTEVEQRISHPQATSAGWTNVEAQTAMMHRPLAVPFLPPPKPPRRPVPKVYREESDSDDSDRRKKFMIGGGAALLVLAVLGGGWAYFANRSYPKGDLPVVADMSATQLWEEFAKDEAGATTKYGNNVVRVKGKISRISTNSNVPVLMLETPRKANWTIEFMFHKNVLKGLSPGQELTIVGECEGKARGNGNVKFSACQIVSQ
jgi:hypothetical protein